MLASHNTSVGKLHNDILAMMRGDAQHSISVDTAEGGAENQAFRIDDEYLHTLEASGILPTRLTLKVGASVILLRNMNPAEGFCNGTRMVVKGQYCFRWSFPLLSYSSPSCQMTEGLVYARVFSSCGHQS